jgi:uncharacterized membrane protein
MILGLSIGVFTTIHTLISIAAIVVGIAVLAEMLADRLSGVLTAIYLALSILTDVTGFMFYKGSFGPPYIVGCISLVILLLACAALYGGKLAGPWRPTYVVGAVIGLYLNVFVAVAQAFGKLPALHKLAPKGSEPPFAIAQGLTLLIFIGLGWLAVRRFRTASPT